MRPIVRVKAKANEMCGAKVAVSTVDGYARIDCAQGDTCNEGQLPQESVAAYRDRYGCDPEAVPADKVYRTRTYPQYCRERGLRLSGPQSGRPSKAEKGMHKTMERQDSAERNAVEGKFGEGKGRHRLDCMRARLAGTSLAGTGLTVTSLQMPVVNLQRRLRGLFVFFRSLL